MNNIMTTTFIKRNTELLLGLKTRGVGAGLWHAFGGKVLNDESLLIAAQRDLFQDCNLSVTDLKQVGLVKYVVGAQGLKSERNVFTASQVCGDIKPSQEMNPIQWFKFEDIPYGSMLPDYRIWCPNVLNNKFFSCFVKYDDEGRILENYSKVFTEVRDIFRNL